MNEELMIWFAQAVAHSLWEGLAIGGGVVVLLRVFRKNPAREYQLLCGAFVLMALCLPLNLALLKPEFRAEAVAETSLAGSEPGSMAVDEILRVGDIENLLLPTAAPAESTSVDSPGGSEEAGALSWEVMAPWVLVVYLLGLVLMLFRLALASMSSRRLRHQGRVVFEEPWTACLDRLAERFGLRMKPALRWSQTVATPILVGVLKPVILLPVALANRLTIAQVEAVLGHELAHLKRHDQWILVLQRVMETILFYHPVLWWMSRELSRSREQACDDLVIAGGSPRADYAETLVICSELRASNAGLRRGAAM